MDLLTGVVVVELARYVATLPFEQRGDRVAERRLPPVADVQRTGRIRRHELDDDALAGARVAPAEAIAGGQHSCDHALPRRVLQRDVEKARPSYLRLVDQMRKRCFERRADRLRQLA